MLEPELFAAFPEADASGRRPMRSATTGFAMKLSRHVSPTAWSTGSARRRARHDRGGRGVARPGRRRLPRREKLLDLEKLWEQIELRRRAESVRVELFTIAAPAFARICRTSFGVPAARRKRQCPVQAAGTGGRKISAAATKLIRAEVRNEAAARRDRLIALGASEEIVRGLVGCSSWTACSDWPPLPPQAYRRAGADPGLYQLGEALGIDWAQQQVARFTPRDQWERLLTAGLARDFEQLRIDFLSRVRADCQPRTQQ
jgi:glutamate dehydrogenase